MGCIDKTRAHSGAALLLLAGLGPAWATFSIVAVDTVTREVGSAGASCLQGALNQSVFIISDVFPGQGAIHTQAQWNTTNQQRAHGRMAAGDSPAQIMAYMQQNDAQGNPGVRQYGAVDLFQGAPRSAAFTGANCMDWKGHITGRNYAIQGNILAFQNMSSEGKRVVDSIEARFLRTQGTLADKLMAALQGGKWRGADSRCWAEGVSTQSAFIRVARPGDAANGFHLDLRVPSRPNGKDPIDSLQTLFSNWKATVSVPAGAPKAKVLDRDGFRPPLEWFGGRDNIVLTAFGLDGKKVWESGIRPGEAVSATAGMRPGIYLLRVRGGGLRKLAVALNP